MKFARIKLIVLIFVLAFIGNARADKPVTVTLLSGIGIPAGGQWGGAYRSSFYSGAESEIRWTKNLATGGIVGYFFGHTDGCALKKEFKNLQIAPYVKYYMDVGNKYSAYGILGPGVYFVNYDDDAATPDVDDSTKRYFGYVVGAGVLRKLGKNFQVGADCRIHQIFRQQFLITTITPALFVQLDF